MVIFQIQIEDLAFRGVNLKRQSPVACDLQTPNALSAAPQLMSLPYGAQPDLLLILGYCSLLLYSFQLRSCHGTASTSKILTASGSIISDPTNSPGCGGLSMRILSTTLAYCFRMIWSASSRRTWHRNAAALRLPEIRQRSAAFTVKAALFDTSAAIPLFASSQSPNWNPIWGGADRLSGRDASRSCRCTARSARSTASATAA